MEIFSKVAIVALNIMFTIIAVPANIYFYYTIFEEIVYDIETRDWKKLVIFVVLLIINICLTLLIVYEYGLAHSFFLKG